MMITSIAAVALFAFALFAFVASTTAVGPAMVFSPVALAFNLVWYVISTFVVPLVISPIAMLISIVWMYGLFFCPLPFIAVVNYLHSASFVTSLLTSNETIMGGLIVFGILMNLFGFYQLLKLISFIVRIIKFFKDDCNNGRAFFRPALFQSSETCLLAPVLDYDTNPLSDFPLLDMTPPTLEDAVLKVLKHEAIYGIGSGDYIINKMYSPTVLQEYHNTMVNAINSSSAAAAVPVAVAAVEINLSSVEPISVEDVDMEDVDATSACPSGTNAPSSSSGTTRFCLDDDEDDNALPSLAEHFNQSKPKPAPRRPLKSILRKKGDPPTHASNPSVSFDNMTLCNKQFHGYYSPKVELFPRDGVLGNRYTAEKLAGKRNNKNLPDFTAAWYQHYGGEEVNPTYQKRLQFAPVMMGKYEHYSQEERKDKKDTLKDMRSKVQFYTAQFHHEMAACGHSEFALTYLHPKDQKSSSPIELYAGCPIITDDETTTTTTATTNNENNNDNTAAAPSRPSTNRLHSSFFDPYAADTTSSSSSSSPSIQDLFTPVVQQQPCPPPAPRKTYPTKAMHFAVLQQPQHHTQQSLPTPPPAPIKNHRTKPMNLMFTAPQAQQPQQPHQPSPTPPPAPKKNKSFVSLKSISSNSTIKVSKAPVVVFSNRR